MAVNKKSANGSTPNTSPSTKEIKEWYEANKKNIENFANAQNSLLNLRDVTKTSTSKTISTINKQTLKSYLQNITSNEKNLRDTVRYLYYRSNILFRLVNWYADMWDLNCRIVYPRYDLVKSGDNKKMLKSYNDTLDYLDLLNLQGNMTERLINVYLQDVSYAIKFTDELGTFFYELNPDECMIDGRYLTGDFSFAMDMSKWKNAQRQAVIEFLGEPLKSMYSEYERTNVKYIHCPDEYSSVFKFRTDTFDTAIPPFINLAIQLSNVEDLVDIQAEADKLDIYKLLYLPLKTRNNSNDVDDFTVDPSLIKRYFDVLMNSAVPDNVAGAIVPVEEIKTIDFSKSTDSDVNSVEKAYNQILQTSGGGAVLNSSKITSTAAFNAWLKEETEFAISTLLPQINGYCKRMLEINVSNPCEVKHFEVSVYTKDELAEKLLTSCQYSFANRLAYNTCLGIPEKATLAMMKLENEILGLPDLMQFPLTSSFTSSGKDEIGQVGQGRDKVDDDQLSDSGDRSRNK